MLRQVMIWLSAVVGLIVLPHIFDSMLSVSVLNQMGIAIVFALSYNMLLGQGGMLSFGHAVYFGLGGFMAAHFMNSMEDFSLPLPVAPLIGGLFGLLFGVIIGSFSTRRAGTVFAMISLGIGEMIAACSLIFVAFFGGEGGVSVDRTMAPPVFGHDFARDIEVYYLIAAWVVVSALLMYLFSGTPAGRMANAVRDNPERAEFIGYSQRQVRFISFCAASFFAGIAGGLFAVNYEIVTEENLNLVASGNVLLMTFIGGVGFFIGPIIGAIVLTLLQTVLSNYTEIWQLYVGLLFVATVMYLPSGLTGVLMAHAPLYRQGRLHALAGPYLKLGAPALAFLVGGVSLLEMLHHLRSSAADEHTLSWFGMTLDLKQWLPWVSALALFGFGVFGLRRLWPGFRERWATLSRPL